MCGRAVHPSCSDRPDGATPRGQAEAARQARSVRPGSGPGAAPSGSRGWEMARFDAPLEAVLPSRRVVTAKTLRLLRQHLRQPPLPRRRRATPCQARYLRWRWRLGRPSRVSWWRRQINLSDRLLKVTASSSRSKGQALVFEAFTPFSSPAAARSLVSTSVRCPSVPGIA